MSTRKTRPRPLVDDGRIEELVRDMTLEEKAAQLTSVPVGLLMEGTGFSERKAEAHLAQGIGQITRLAGGADITPSQAAEIGNRIQSYLTTRTRQGIPALVHEECLAGVLAKGATAFPVPLSLAATWDLELVRDVTGEIGRSVRAIGGHQGLCPVLDVVRDPRWGRVEETFGEDHHLVARMGVAYVRGLQGEDLALGIIATGKHFAGHGFSEGGRNCAPVHVGPRELREVFLYPFERAIREAGMRGIMNAYHDLDGVPCGASKELLTDILRGEWGFDGIVVSDYFAIPRLKDVHGTAGDYAEAAAQALRAGLDIELPQTQCYGAPLVEAVKRGLLTEETVNVSVRRMLRMKMLTGVFERNQVDAPRAGAAVATPSQRDLARRAATESLVLLKNDGEILPLPRDLGSVAVVGPNAASARNLLGDYSFATHVSWNEHDLPVVTVLEGIRAAVSRDTQIRYARGCATSGEDREGFAAAVEAARRSEVCVYVCGDQSGLSLPTDTTGEANDRAELGLPGVQEELLVALVATGTPVVVVLVNGRIFTLPWMSLHARAILEAWLPGQEGGNAVADVLFGAVSPSGKLPVSYPRETGQIPVNYNRTRASVVKYLYTPATPLYPFGHGLSYARFDYDGLEVTGSANRAGLVIVTFGVKNTGTRAADEVAQVYVRDVVASYTRPVRELKGFERISLKGGERKQVSIEIQAADLGFPGPGLDRVVEPGVFDVLVGSSSEDIRLRGSFRIT